MDKQERCEQLRAEINNLRHYPFPWQAGTRRADLQVWEIAWREQEVRRLREELEAS